MPWAKLLKPVGLNLNGSLSTAIDRFSCEQRCGTGPSHGAIHLKCVLKSSFHSIAIWLAPGNSISFGLNHPDSASDLIRRGAKRIEQSSEAVRQQKAIEKKLELNPESRIPSLTQAQPSQPQAQPSRRSPHRPSWFRPRWESIRQHCLSLTA